MAFDLAKEKSTHNEMLIRTILVSSGPVLEAGAGMFSTPLMHWLCYIQGRHLVTYENNPRYFGYAKEFESKDHEVKLIDNWDKMDFSRHWGVVFLDHNPDPRRVEDVINFAQSADYIVIHDTDREDKYHMSKAWPYFRFIYTWKACRPWTSVVSNFKDLVWLNNPFEKAQKIIYESKS